MVLLIIRENMQNPLSKVVPLYGGITCKKILLFVPVPILQNGGSRRTRLSLLIDINGNIVIENSWGHGGSSEQLFYTINEYGDLVSLEMIVSFDFDRSLWDIGKKSPPSYQTRKRY